MIRPHSIIKTVPASTKTTQINELIVIATKVKNNKTFKKA